MATTVFPITSYIQQTNLKGYTYVTLSFESKQMYIAQAPIMGIQISQQIDYNLIKSLSGNFGMLTFEDHPVSITISGLRMALQPTCSLSAANRNATTIQSLSKLYTNYRGSIKNASKQSLLTVTVGTDTYKGVIVSLQQGSASQSLPGVMQYKLTMYGARV